MMTGNHSDKRWQPWTPCKEINDMFQLREGASVWFLGTLCLRGEDPQQLKSYTFFRDTETEHVKNRLLDPEFSCRQHRWSPY